MGGETHRTPPWKETFGAVWALHVPPEGHERHQPLSNFNINLYVLKYQITSISI
jgi:hypothetical protein